MKKGILPQGMWLLFKPSFQRNLPLLGVAADNSDKLMEKAKCTYREILEIIPTFGKDDILLVNILSASMLASVYMSMNDN